MTLHHGETFADIQLPTDGVPSVSFDLHFRNVPRLRQVDFDAEKCAALFREIGIKERTIPGIHVFVRPDYELAYTKQERQELAKKDPDFDDESASVAWMSDGSLFMTIVYGTEYNPNSLLRHEAAHIQLDYATERRRKIKALTSGGVGLLGAGANVVLDSFWVGPAMMLGWFSLLYSYHRYVEHTEEEWADRIQDDPDLKRKYKNIITVERRKRH